MGKTDKVTPATVAVVVQVAADIMVVQVADYKVVITVLIPENLVIV
jgi:hypothetical protein